MAAVVELDNKESQNFKHTIKYYDDRNYKKALKHADLVLKKYPTHGESLTMKGISFYYMDTKKNAAGAEELLKLGLRHGMRSRLCWHMYGIFLRCETRYTESVKYHIQAARLEPDYGVILRDLAFMQCQLRDYTSNVETRTKILRLNSKNPQNWIGLAAAFHLEGSVMPESVLHALRILTIFIKTKEWPKFPSFKDKYEFNELYLYQAMLYKETGQYAEGAAELKAVFEAARIIDRLTYLEVRGELLLLAGQLDGAREHYLDLIKINPENGKYHSGYMATFGVKDLNEASDSLLSAYLELEKLFPKAVAPKKILLRLTQGEEFHARLVEYMEPKLRKGVPSLYDDLRSVVDGNAAKAETLVAVVEEFDRNLTACQKFQVNAKVKELPSSQVWVQMFLADVRNGEGRTELALSLLNKALDHTSTALDAYTTRARVLRDAGAYMLASYEHELARKLDLADRGLNTESIKMLCLAGETERATTVSTFFTRDSEVYGSIHEMQVLWFEICLGNAYAAKGESGKALKMYHYVHTHVGTFYDDQFDFHGYCFRRSTYRHYIDMVRAADRIYARPEYVTAAVGAIKVYIDLHDFPPGTKMSAALEREFEGLSEAEKKKKLSKMNKAAKKAAATTAPEPVAPPPPAKKGVKGKKRGRKPVVVDADPDGAQLAAVEKPLDAAMAFVTKLLAFAWDSVDAHVACGRVFIRRGKFVPVFRSLIRARELAPTQPSVHLFTVEALHALERDGSESMRTLLAQEVAAILGGASSVADFNARYESTQAATFEERTAAIRASFVLGTRSRSDLASALTSAVAVSSRPFKLAAFEEAMTFLRSVGEEAAGGFRAAARSAFPYADAFKEDGERFTWPDGDDPDDPLTEAPQEALARLRSGL